MNQSKVLVAGTGISGIAAAKAVLERGGEVVLYDGNTALNTDEIRAKFREKMRKWGSSLVRSSARIF